MQRVPPRYALTHEDDATSDASSSDARRAKPKRRRSGSSPVDVFDVRRWRLPSKWRNDRRVGDVTMAKMLAGVDPARFEALARGEL